MTQSFWETAVGPGALRELSSARLYGVVEAIVSNNVDPEGLGRVKVRFPWWTGREGEETSWARIGRGFAGNEHGSWFLPEVEDEVLVMFEHGDVRFPFVVGCLWNRKDRPPVFHETDASDKTRKPEQVAGPMDDLNKNGEDDVRAIASRAGHILRFHDKAGVAIMDNTGIHRIDLLPDTCEVQVTNGDGDIHVRAPVGTVRLKGVNVTTESSTFTKISSLDRLELVGKQTLEIQAGRGLELAGMEVSEAVAGAHLDFASGISTVAVAMQHFTGLSPTGNVTLKSLAPIRLLGAKVAVNPPDSVGKKLEGVQAQALTAGATLGALLTVMRDGGDEEKKKELAEALAEVFGKAQERMDAAKAAAGGGVPPEVQAPPADPLDAPPQKAADVPGRPEPKPNPEKDAEGKLVFRMQFGVDPNSTSNDDDHAELKSKDGSYVKKLRVMDGQQVSAGLVELVFEGLHPDNYTLSYDPGKEGAPYALFENRPIG